MSDLKCKIKSVEFSNPIFTASGTYGYGNDFPPSIELGNIGAIVTKSITFEAREGNPPPRIVETPSGMLNSIGLANIGVRAFIDEVLPTYESLNTKIIVNIAGSSQAEYLNVINDIDAASQDISGYEINISCPNVDHGGMEFGVDSEMSFELITEIRKLTNKLLIVKLSPNVTDIAEIAMTVEKAGADAISAINTVVGMGIDINTRKPTIYRTYAGLSGPAIRPIALANVHKISKVVNIPIIGIGGISKVEHIVQFLLAGATAVQIGTANFKNPNIYKKLVSELDEYLKNYKINNYSDLIGELKTYV